MPGKENFLAQLYALTRRRHVGPNPEAAEAQKPPHLLVAESLKFEELPHNRTRMTFGDTTIELGTHTQATGLIRQIQQAGGELPIEMLFARHRQALNGLERVANRGGFGIKVTEGSGGTVSFAPLTEEEKEALSQPRTPHKRRLTGFPQKPITLPPDYQDLQPKKAYEYKGQRYLPLSDQTATGIRPVDELVRVIEAYRQLQEGEERDITDLPAIDLTQLNMAQFSPLEGRQPITPSEAFWFVTGKLSDLKALNKHNMTTPAQKRAYQTLTSPDGKRIVDAFIDSINPYKQPKPQQ